MNEFTFFYQENYFSRVLPVLDVSVDQGEVFDDEDDRFFVEDSFVLYGNDR